MGRRFARGAVAGKQLSSRCGFGRNDLPLVHALRALCAAEKREGRTIAITEESRYQLFQSLEQALGTERAATLMELLPPVGWADVTTKRDLDQSHSLLMSELDRAVATLRGEMAELRGELRGEMGELGAGLRSEMGELRADFFREQRNQTLALVGANTAIAAVLLAAIRLL